MGNLDEILSRGVRDPISPTARPRPSEPSKHAVVLTCMDTRINPYRLFNLDEGEVHILRNAGGVITDDVIRSLIVSQRKLNTTEILVLQHTQCGMATFDGEEFKDELQRETNVRPHFDIHTFEDVYDNVVESVKQIQASPFLGRTTHVKGFVYDVIEDKLVEVHTDS